MEQDRFSQLLSLSGAILKQCLKGGVEGLFATKGLDAAGSGLRLLLLSLIAPWLIATIGTMQLLRGVFDIVTGRRE